MRLEFHFQRVLCVRPLPAESFVRVLRMKMRLGAHSERVLRLKMLLEILNVFYV